MADSPVTITPDSAPASPVTITPDSAPETGVWAGVKRNTVGAVSGLFHAFADPATDAEKQEIKAKVDADSDKTIPDSVWSDPSKITLAYHRLVDAPADQLNAKGKSEQDAAKDLLAKRETWKGANLYTSGAVDRGLAAVPMLGPFVNSIAQRAESGDVSGAATDVAAAVAAPHIAEAAGKLASTAADIPAFKNKLATMKPDLVAHLEKTHSFTGQAAAYLADKMLPDSPEALAQAQRAVEEGKSKDINDAITLQDTYNRRVAREQAATQRTQAAQDRITARQKATADAAAAKVDAEARAPQSIKQSPNYNPQAYVAGRASVNPIPPEQPVYPGASQPAAEDFYANRGEDIVRAMKQQPEAFAPPPKPEFPGASLPSSEDFYSQRGTEINDIRKMQDMEARKRAADTKSTQDAGLKLPSTSGGPKSPNEGRPATWTNDTVRQLAAWGDNDAITQARLRGFGTVPKKYSAVDIAPKSTTLFDAHGNPVPSGGTAPMANVMANRMTLNPVGETGARAIVSPENQFESSFGPEHQEVGDLAEWETGDREGLNSKKKRKLVAP